MSGSDADTRLTSPLHKIPRFHGKRGEDYGLWRLRLCAVCRAKNMWKLVDLDAASASRVASDQDSEKQECACSIIIAALDDSPLRIVADVYEDTIRMIMLLDDLYASSRAASRIAVQTELNRNTYRGGNISTFINEFGTLYSHIERMEKDAATPESPKALMLLLDIPTDSTLQLMAAALHTKDVADLIWEFFATTLIDENEARSMRTHNVDTDGDPQRID
jgi:hypothetical protein